MMKAKLLTLMVALAIAIVPLSTAELSDAGDSEAIGIKTIRGANVYVSTVEHVTYEPGKYCFVPGSDGDEEMQDFLKNGGSHPIPLMIDVPGEKEYRMYSFTTGETFVSQENLIFTVTSNGDVDARLMASSEITLASYNHSVTDTAINKTLDMKAGDLLVVRGANVEDFNNLWISVEYDLTNVRVSESKSLSETNVLTYVVIGIGVLCLIAILISRRPPLSKRALKSIRPSKPVIGKIFAIAVVAAIAGAGVYAYTSSPGNSDVDSLEFREGLTLEKTVYLDGELKEKYRYTIVDIDEGMCEFTVKRYNASGIETASSTLTWTIAEFELWIRYYGSAADAIEASNNDDIKTERVTIDSAIGTVRCDKLTVTLDGGDTRIRYIYHGMELRTELISSSHHTVEDLTGISYA